ncbi:MAG: SdpI family protein [Patescibacteria group bacterium]
MARSPADPSPLDAASPAAAPDAKRGLRPLLVLRWAMIAGMFALAAALYPSLPDRIPTHWNFAGVPDQFSPKTYGAWLVPGIALLMAVLFPVFQRFDPKRANYADLLHTWDVLQTAFVGFMAYLYGITLLATFDPAQSPLVGRGVVLGVGALFVVIGNSMGKIRQNWFVGLRTPWTLSDPETWRRSQRFGGWAFVLGGLAVMAEAFFWIHPVLVFFGIVLLVTVLPIAYSFLIFPKANAPSTRGGKKSYLLLILFCMATAFAVAVGVRLVSSEDDWICSDGQWVKHGNPRVPQPTTPCP